MATTNFLAWANAANIESDPTWASDPLRTGDIPVNAVLPSPMLNKLFRQATVFQAALGQALATKGYSTSDASQNTLSAVLAGALITAFDLANSPALGGNPTAPTQGSSDNSARIATTAFVQAVVALFLVSAEGYTNLLTPTLNGNNPGQFRIPAFNGFPGVIIQFGNSTIPGSAFTPTGIAYVSAFPNGTLITIACASGTSSAPVGSAPDGNGAILLYNSASTNIGVNWIAIGY